MSGNNFNSLMAEVNSTLSEMNMAISEANAAAASARENTDTSGETVMQAEAAVRQAQEAAQAAQEEAEKWAGATVSAETLEPGRDASVAITEKNGVKHMTFSLPRGADGNAGAKGDPGDSGVSFRLSGTSLYITMD